MLSSIVLVVGPHPGGVVQTYDNYINSAEHSAGQVSGFASCALLQGAPIHLVKCQLRMWLIGS